MLRNYVAKMRMFFGVLMVCVMLELSGCSAFVYTDVEEVTTMVNVVADNEETTEAKAEYKYIYKEKLTTDSWARESRKAVTNYTVEVMVPISDDIYTDRDYISSERMGICVDFSLEPLTPGENVDIPAGVMLDVYLERTYDEFNHVNYKQVELSDVKEIDEDHAYAHINYIEYEQDTNTHKVYDETWYIEEAEDGIYVLMLIKVDYEEITGKSEKLLAELEDYYGIHIKYDEDAAERKCDKYVPDVEEGKKIFSTGYMIFELPDNWHEGEGWGGDENSKSYTPGENDKFGNCSINMHREYVGKDYDFDSKYKDEEANRKAVENELSFNVESFVQTEMGETVVGDTIKAVIKIYNNYVPYDMVIYSGYDGEYLYMFEVICQSEEYSAEYDAISIMEGILKDARVKKDTSLEKMKHNNDEEKNEKSDGEDSKVNEAFMSVNKYGISVDVFADMNIREKQEIYTAAENLEYLLEEEFSFFNANYVEVEISQINKVDEYNAYANVNYIDCTNEPKIYGAVFYMVEEDGAYTLHKIIINYGEVTKETEKYVEELNEYYGIDIWYAPKEAFNKIEKYKASGMKNKRFSTGYLTFELPSEWAVNEKYTDSDKFAYSPGGESELCVISTGIEDSYDYTREQFIKVYFNEEAAVTSLKTLLGEMAQEITVTDMGETVFGTTVKYSITLLDNGMYGRYNIYYGYKNGQVYFLDASCYEDDGNCIKLAEEILKTGVLK